MSAVAEVHEAIPAARRILTKLALLSDGEVKQNAPTQIDHMWPNARLRTRTGKDNLPARPNKGGGSSQIPAGVDERPGERAPDKGLSLYAHYLWRMKRAITAGDGRKLRELVYFAEKDYDEHTRGSLTERYEYHTEAVKALLSEWPGVPAAEVAAYTGAEEKWVRRQRALAGTDPETGGAPTGQLAEIVGLLAKGHSQTDVAAILGVTKGRVSQVLNAVRRPRGGQPPALPATAGALVVYEDWSEDAELIPGVALAETAAPMYDDYSEDSRA